MAGLYEGHATCFPVARPTGHPLAHTQLPTDSCGPATPPQHRCQDQAQQWPRHLPHLPSAPSILASSTYIPTAADQITSRASHQPPPIPPHRPFSAPTASTALRSNQPPTDLGHPSVRCSGSLQTSHSNMPPASHGKENKLLRWLKRDRRSSTDSPLSSAPGIIPEKESELGAGRGSRHTVYNIQGLTEGMLGLRTTEKDRGGPGGRAAMTGGIASGQGTHFPSHLVHSASVPMLSSYAVTRANSGLIGGSGDQIINVHVHLPPSYDRTSVGQTRAAYGPPQDASAGGGRITIDSGSSMGINGDRLISAPRDPDFDPSRGYHRPVPLPGPQTGSQNFPAPRDPAHRIDLPHPSRPASTIFGAKFPHASYSTTHDCAPPSGWNDDARELHAGSPATSRLADQPQPLKGHAPPSHSRRFRAKSENPSVQHTTNLDGGQVRSRRTSLVPVGGALLASPALQCAGYTTKGMRCKRMVKASAAVNSLGQASLGPTPTAADENVWVDGGGEKRYCKDHVHKVLHGSDGFYWRYPHSSGEAEGGSGQKGARWVRFEEYLPSREDTEVDEQTRVLLMLTMESSLTDKETPGFIYAYELRDLETDALAFYKVGRTDNVPRRLDEWKKQCASHHPTPRDIFPLPHSCVKRHPSVLDKKRRNQDGFQSLMSGNMAGGVDGRDMCVAVKRLERLIHIELACRSPVPLSKLPCPDCSTVHKEIFPIAKRRERESGGGATEYETVVREVICRWERFIREVVDGN